MASSWEFREITMPRGTTRDEAKALLVDCAEREHWELARVRLYADGRRRVWLRRRIIRVVRTA
jgi:hypothetical protein